MSNIETEWFCIIAGERKGPLTAEQVKALAETGSVDGDTMVWCETMTDWAPLHSTPLRSIFGAAGLSWDGRGADPLQHEDGPALSLWGYFVRCFTTHYFNFQGRARRAEYWGFGLFMALIAIALGILAATVIGDFGYVFVGLFVLATIIPSISLSVRRIHDIGLSGWFVLVNFVPYVGSIVMLVFSLLPSQARVNKWGPIPAGA